MNKKVILSLLLVALLVIVGCQKADAPAAEPTPEETKTEEAPKEEPKEETTAEEPKEEAPAEAGKLVFVGSTSVTPAAEALGEAFREKEGIQVEVQGVGSSAGIKAANEKTADIGMSSRNLKDEEKDFGLTETVLAHDGIAVCVNPSNGVEDLTMEQIQKIFTGEIKNWSEVGGEDLEIIILSREDGSGTRGAFEELTGLDKDLSVSPDALIADANGAVQAQLASKAEAIGYLSLAYVDESVKAVKVEGVEATPEKILAGEYKISRPFLLLTQGEASDTMNKFMEFITTDEAKEILKGLHLVVQ